MLKYQYIIIAIKQKFSDEEFDADTQNKISKNEKLKLNTDSLLKILTE